MSHFIVNVLIPKSQITKMSHDGVTNIVTDILAPFDENLKVEPRQVYLSPDDEKHMLDHYKIDPMAADVNAQLAAKLESWKGYAGQLDSKGNVFWMSTTNQQSKWDWWQIGGRWTGWLGNYDPTTDPENFERCALCDGTGKRNDALGKQAREDDPTYTCNGCNGKGTSIKWSLKNYDGDILPVANILEKIPFALVTPDGAWHEQGEMGWFASVSSEKDEDLWKEEVQLLYAQHLDCVAVAVDCHV